MPNQHLLLVPEELIRPRLEELWRMEGGITDIVLCDKLQKVFDTSKYTLGLSSFKRMRKCMGFLSTRQQDHMVETITEPIEELRECFPKAGYFELKKHLQINHKLHVSRDTIKEWSYANEPKSVTRQLRKDMVQKVFYCAGVNDLCGVLKWMKIWWNKSNPVFICKYYLDVVEANRSRAQTFLRQWADPELCNTVQHRWMAEKMNIPSKIVWSVLHMSFSFGYEGLLQHGVDQGWYDPKVTFSPESIQTARQLYAPIDHPVLELVPESFQQCTEEFMDELGNPEIKQDCVWNIYLALLGKFHAHRIIAVDEWDIFFDDDCYEKTQSHPNQRQGTIHINSLNPLVIADLQDKEVEGNGSTLSHKESDDLGEEEFEISGEVPNLEMSLTNFMQHMGV
ncbi:hypothetical protein EDD85DRAFT_797931 [Armillaria nabsnona]|nr:hypothetical protein EDD85DRAFT_797931 [Armillaria nabsnona]